MIDVERLNELPTYSRMAWSTRPVWDRRSAGRRGATDRVGVAVARRPQPHRAGHHPRQRVVSPMAQLVVNGGRSDGR